jgi:hypothetical protein
MKAKTMGMICLFLIIALAASAYAMPVEIERVKLDGTTLSESGTNRLDIEKNQDYEVMVKLTALEDIKNAEVKVFVSGFEYSSTEPAQEDFGPFNLDANHSKTIKFDIDFSDEFEEDDYLLRVMVIDRDDGAEIETYRIKVDVPRNSLKIEDVIFYPESNLKDGEALLASVRVENNGEKDQDDVRVTVAIPELAMMARSYLNEVEAEDEEPTEEMYMKVPRCAQPGLHEVLITVEYSEGHYATSTTRYINIEETPACMPVVEAPVEGTEATPEVVDGELTEAQEPEVRSTSKVRKALEIILLILVVLLVIIGLVIGLGRLGRAEEEY